ncbi:alpha/beta hydrolase [Pseudoalteromonas sp.]|uniref:alpha/beta hydrolase n=1 Tax=Pseudoalteromonas sp. TaxID=53249 RepID=UPI003568DF38
MKTRNLNILVALILYTLVMNSLNGDAWASDFDLAAHYQHNVKQVKVEQQPLDAEKVVINFTSFDGAQVNGQISYPKIKRQQYPLVIAMHAMGRSYPRWWHAELKGSKTVTQVHKLTELAHQNGFAVIALDARHHGSRKQADVSLKEIMTNLHQGDKQAYQDMIRHSILDYRLLLDWLHLQPQFKDQQIRVVGYSMGGQMALLLAAIDERVSEVLSIVPPHIDDTMPVVAPVLAAKMIDDKAVTLLTANQDQYATEQQNQTLFDAIASKDKVRLVFNADHILPESYVEKIRYWF